MDTKMQSLPTTHAQPHSSARAQSHGCGQCHCSRHCLGCSQSPASLRSPPGNQSQGPSPGPSSPLQRRPHSPSFRHSPRPTMARSSCGGRGLRNRRTFRGKVNKRRVVRRRRQGCRMKRRCPGRKYK